MQSIQSMKKYLFLFIAMLSLPASGLALNVGEKAPDFTLMDLDDHSQTLSSQQGKFVVLEWFNYDCPFVKKHYGSGNMQALQKKWTDQGVVWWSINSSASGKQGNYSPEDMKKLAEERKTASSAIVLDPDGIVGKSYEAKTTPHLYVINPEGQLIYQGAIDDQPSSEPETIQGAKNYADQALEQATQSQPVTDSSTKSYGCSIKY